MLDVNESTLSIQSNNLSDIIKEEEVDVNSHNLSNSSMITINKYINMIPDQNQDLIHKRQEEKKEAFQSNMKMHSKKSLALLPNSRITEQIKQKISNTIYETKKKSNINSYKNYMTNVNNSNTFLRKRTEGSIKELGHYYYNNPVKVINQQEYDKTNTFLKPNSLTSPTTPIKNTIQKKSLEIIHNCSHNNVLHISNKLQKNKKKMLLGLYKHKIEFEKELDTFKDQFEKKDKRLIDFRLYPTLMSQNLSKSNNSSTITTMNSNRNMKIKNVKSIFPSEANHYYYCNTLSNI